MQLNTAVFVYRHAISLDFIQSKTEQIVPDHLLWLWSDQSTATF